MMKFDNKEDDERDDFFQEYAPEEPKPEKKPTLETDDPRYWEQPEGEWDYIMHRVRRRRVKLIAAALILALVIIFGTYIWFFTPRVDDAVHYGYVDHIERRGELFKTYEGNLISYKEIHDTTRDYKADFTFSASERIGRVLRSYQNSGKPLRVEYAVYRVALPWRGDTRTVIQRVDTVSPDSILPMPRLQATEEPGAEAVTQ